jgi:hypothetical protein
MVHTSHQPTDRQIAKEVIEALDDEDDIERKKLLKLAKAILDERKKWHVDIK